MAQTNLESVEIKNIFSAPKNFKEFMVLLGICEKND